MTEVRIPVRKSSRLFQLISRTFELEPERRPNFPITSTDVIKLPRQLRPLCNWPFLIHGCPYGGARHKE